MADFNSSTTSVKWYNVLSFHFMQPEVKRPPQATRPASLHVKQVEDKGSVQCSLLNKFSRTQISLEGDMMTNLVYCHGFSKPLVYSIGFLYI